MRTIAIANSKGGCGKTTTAVNLAAAMAQRGSRVLMVDLDPQAHTTLALGHDPKTLSKTIYHCLVDKRISISTVAVGTPIEGLKLAPSNILLANADFELPAAPSKIFVLADRLKRVKDEYEICIIDCPPSLGLLTLNALVASTDVIAPVQLHYYALESLKQLLATIELIRERFSDCRIQTLGLLLTFVESATLLTQEIERQIRQYFGDFVFQTVIHRSIDLAEAPSAGQSILPRATEGTWAADYRAWAEELCDPESQKKHRLTEESSLSPLSALTRPKKFRPAAAIASLAKIPHRVFHLRTMNRKVGLILGLAVLLAIMVSMIPATMVNRPPVAVHFSVSTQDETAVPDCNDTNSFVHMVNDGTVDSNSTMVLSTVQAVDYAPIAEPNEHPLDGRAATVSANVAVNRPPTADSQSVTTAQDTPVPITLMGNDEDEDPLTYTVETTPTKGNLSGAAPDLKYTPDPNFNGLDSFTYIMNDGSQDSDPATVSITVTSANNPPVAERQDATTQQEKPITIDTPVNTSTPPSTIVWPIEPHTTTLTITDGYDEKSRRMLSAEGKTSLVQSRDSNCCETDAGLYTSYDFSDLSIPAEAVITSVSIYVQHFEEEQFPSGKLQWSVGTGWPNTPVVWVSIDAPVRQGKENEAIEGWNVTSFVKTVEKVNSLQLRVKNNDVIGKKKTLADYIYAEVTWH